MPVEKIQIEPIGFVERTSNNDNVTDRNLISKIVVNKDLNKALDGIEDFSHIFIIFWMHQISKPDTPILHHPGKTDSRPVGIFATRAPIRPNPIGLTLVELLNREKNVLWVKGLDAYDGTPILDLKPFGWRSDVVANYEIPTWLMDIIKQH